MSTHARPLAVRLAAATDAQLASLFAARGVRTDAGWQDFFDAAEGLLETTSIERMLPRLTRAEAVALRHAVAGEDAGTQRDALVALALLRDDGTPQPPVADAVRTRPAVDAADPGTEPAPASDTAAAHAAERALTSVAMVADILLLARDAALPLLATGRIAAGEKRRIAESGVPADLIDDLAELAAASGLVRAHERGLHLCAAGEQWLALPAGARWRQLAEGFRDALPRGVRTTGHGWIPLRQWPGAHPWDPSWPERCAALRARASLLGLVADGDGEPPWAVPLREGHDAEPALLQQLLPAEVDRIFLQNDLTAISPGPLSSPLDVRLRTMAARESAAQASSYRFTAESITRALVLGETEQSILDFLDGISLTGIPQPLAYLVAQTAARHGLVRVSSDADGRTRIASTDRTLLESLAVDQSLRPLGLLRDGQGLTTRVARDTVYWALTDARYPATLVDADGEIVTPRRTALQACDPDAAPSYAALIRRLRDHQGADADAAWLDRELEAAVRAKAELLIEVAMPDGTTRRLVLEASGMGGGRLRGRDRAADVERTLPISSIRSARILEPQ